jgi:hypothetical protein
MEPTRNFIASSQYPKFEISTSEPWQFRHIDIFGNLRLINPYYNEGNGYYYVSLDKRAEALHRIIAGQFIPNPEGLLEVDHISRNKTDNSIQNLRWCSRNINMRNKNSHCGAKYQYLNQLPDGYVPFTEYEMKNGTKRIFKNLYLKMENNKPKFITDNSEHYFRYLHENINDFGSRFVSYRDIHGKSCSICFNRISKAQKQQAQTQQVISQTQNTIAETENTLAKAILNLTEILKSKNE